MQIPDNLKAEYAVAQNQKNSWPREYVIQLIERIATGNNIPTAPRYQAEVITSTNKKVSPVSLAATREAP